MYAHQCADADKYTAERRKEMSYVWMHDGVSRIDIGSKSIYVKYCPICGCNLEKEEYTNEWLSNRYSIWG